MAYKSHVSLSISDLISQSNIKYSNDNKFIKSIADNTRLKREKLIGMLYNNYVECITQAINAKEPIIPIDGIGILRYKEGAEVAHNMKKEGYSREEIIAVLRQNILDAKQKKDLLQ